MTYRLSMAAEAFAMSTSLSWPPANCQRPLIIRGISSDPAIVVRSGRECAVVIVAEAKHVKWLRDVGGRYFSGKHLGICTSVPYCM